MTKTFPENFFGVSILSKCNYKQMFEFILILRFYNNSMLFKRGENELFEARVRCSAPVVDDLTQVSNNFSSPVIQTVFFSMRA